MRPFWNSEAKAGSMPLHGFDAAPRYWTSLSESGLPVERSPRSRSYDAIIVGAGLTGALIADGLSSRGLCLLVIDRRMPVSAGTAGSTAILRCGLPGGLARSSEALGSSIAEHLWHRTEQAVERLLATVAELGVDCGLERRRSLHLGTSEQDAEALEAETALRNMAGIRSQFLTKTQLLAQYGLDSHGALLAPMAAVLNPVQLANALLLRAARRGTDIVANMEILEATQSGGRVHLLTSDGDFLSAGEALFCTGSEVPDGVMPQAERQVPVTSLVTRPGLDLPHWLDRCVVSRGTEDELALRTTADGRLMAHRLAGTEDRKDWPHALPGPHPVGNLAAEVSALLGVDLGEPDWCWTDHLPGRPFGLPLLTPLASVPQAQAVLGHGANGIVFSKMAADMVLAALEGRPDPDQALLSSTGAAHARSLP